MCGPHNLAFPVRLNSLHLSNIRYSYTLTGMSLVERNDLNFVVKSSTVHLVGQAIVHITTKPSTTKLVAFTFHDICLPEVVKVRPTLIVIFVSNGVSNIAVANGASSCTNISLGTHHLISGGGGGLDYYFQLCFFSDNN